MATTARSTGGPAPLRKAYGLLARHYGAQRWWPSSIGAGVAGPWEVAVGAILVQHTQWKNVVRAIRALDDAGVLSPRAIVATDAERLAAVVRPAGTPRVKADRLKALAAMVTESPAGSIDGLLAGVTSPSVARQRRELLLGVKGVGPETADSILLYGGGAPVFVVDAYKRRVMSRHGWGDPRAGYDEVARFWRRRLPADSAVYAEAHALLVRVGAEHCRARSPRCAGCPLERLLPPGGAAPGG